MRTWEIRLEIDPSRATPLFLQISKGIVEAIRSGRLLPGAALPSTRALADSLKVNRNTTLAAYQELAAEGWVQSRAGGGTFVAPRLPQDRSQEGTALKGDELGFELAPAHGATAQAPLSPATLTALSGVPDPSLLPDMALARAYRRAVLRQKRDALRGMDPRGNEGLRIHLASMLASLRGVTATKETLLVLGGVQISLFLVAQALLSDGDGVAVEALGHRPAWEAFEKQGARLLPIPLDAEGMQVDALGQLVETQRIRAVYLTPQRQYPTTVQLSTERRKRLLELAQQHRFAIIEYDYDSEFHYEGRPPIPLAGQDAHGLVIHVGGLAKLYSDDLRMGFVHAPRPFIDRMTRLRSLLDARGDRLLEMAISDLMEEGEFQRHLLRMRPIYLARRDCLVDLLRREFPEELSLEVPSGGMALWVSVRNGVDVDRWASLGLRHGVAFQSGKHYTFDGSSMNCIRVGFTAYAEPVLREMVLRMRKAWNELRA